LSVKCKRVISASLFNRTLAHLLLELHKVTLSLTTSVLATDLKVQCWIFILKLNHLRTISLVKQFSLQAFVRRS